MARFSVTACLVQMKRKAYYKFSLPPNQKATAGKAGTLSPRGGARNPPRRPQKSPRKTNQSPSQSLLLAGCLHANDNQACQPARPRPSAPCLTLFIRCTKDSLQAQRHCSPSLGGLCSAGEPTSNLGSSDSGIWEMEATGVCKQHWGLCIQL